MPTYDYVCDACEHKFEQFQSIKADALVKCPACGKRKLRRLIGGGAAIVFKGSGFYKTDYRSDAYKKRAESDAKPAGDAKPSGDSSSSSSKESGGKSSSGDSGAAASKK